MNLKVVEEELRKGLEATSHFRSMLIGKERGDEFSEEKKIEFLNNYSTTMLNSFDNSINILNKIIHSKKWVASSSLAQTLANVGPPKNRQRKVIEASTLTPDGHTWRKYGQKLISNNKHPREYYRCAYREEQDCQATKQVQMISNIPSKFRIIYFSHHTCQPLLNNNYIINKYHMLDSVEQDLTNNICFEFKKPAPPPNQDLNNLVILNSSSFSNNLVLDPLSTHEGCNTSPSLSTTAVYHPTTSLDLTTEKASSLANEIASLNLQDEVLCSPRVFMNPNYLASSNLEAIDDYNVMIVDDYFDMEYMDNSLLDLPLWD